MNIVEQVAREIERVTEVRLAYVTTPQGGLAARLMRVSLEAAEKALGSGDPVEIMRALKDLQGWHL